MASPSPCQPPPPQHSTPFFPGAWPSASDEGHDPDMSTVSYPGLSDLRTPDFASDNARRRWTYAGPILPLATKPTPTTPTSLDHNPLTVSASQGSRMSRFTDNTLSSAASSTLNTPDMTRWSALPPTTATEPGIAFSGGEARQDSPNSFTYITKAPALRHGAMVAPVKQTPSPSGHDRFVSPYLDPPLLNLVPGLPPLKLPASNLPLGFSRRDSTPAPPSPPSESCSTPLSFDIPSPRRDYAPSSLRSSSIIPLSEIAADFFPAVGATPEPSPRATIASLPSSSHISFVDSFVLPSSEVDLIRTPGRSHGSFVQSTPSAPEMDAFALAAAVAASPSGSSLAIPPSLQSTSASPAILERSLAPEELLPPARRQSSNFTDASAGHHYGTAHSQRGRDVEYARESLAVDSVGRARMRRRSAPPPASRRSPRPSTTKTVTSRVDVGDRSTLRKVKSTKQPMFGKMRRFGEKIRGLFKTKGDGQLRNRAATVGEYGLMTTTTAITNIEYESEHPIPAPSPRSKMLRNHRRSLPLPSLLLPSSADNLASSIFKRPSASRASSSRPQETSSSPARGAGQAPRDERPTYTHSPHTPRPQRERTRTAPQARGTEANLRSGRKARRFSLSSALSKSRLDTLRSTMMPRPPLPPMPSRNSHDDSTTVVVLSCDETVRSYGSPSVASGYGVRTTSRQGSYWGGELPDVPVSRIPQYSLPAGGSDCPRRGRTQTAPPEPQTSRPSEAVTTTPKSKRLRRFSLSSMMARRASRTRIGIGAFHGQPPVPVSTDIFQNAPRSTFQHTRPRGDTVSTITPRVPLNVVQTRNDHVSEVRPSLPHAIVSRSNRISLAPSTASSHAGSAYFDAREQLSEDTHHHPSLEGDRSCSPGPESDLDSMSFARTPDYSSGTFSFGSSIERRRYSDTDELSVSGSYTFRPEVVGRCASTSVVSQLVSENTSTPVTKTLRFSPSLSLSFERSWSDDGDEDELGRMEREEEAGFMRALGFEFDEIARRAREDAL